VYVLGYTDGVSSVNGRSSWSSSSSSWWNDSTSVDIDAAAETVDKSLTADGELDGAGRPVGSPRHCRTNADCELSSGRAGTGGVSCYWLYDGCQTGRCMCDPQRHLQSVDGHCIPRQLLHTSSLVTLL